LNFLGHFYLSQHDPELLIGNFIADFVKGKRYLEYPERIAEGILMHRHIDYFTDRHALVRNGRKRLFDQYRHYSGVIIDMYYDHFLANLWPDYSSEELSVFADSVYHTIEAYEDILPEKAQFLFPYMKSGNWLVRYASTEGIGQSLNGMSRRLNNNSKLNLAVHQLHEHYDEFREEFREFIPDIEKQFEGGKI
jgi:acyl carrier protein phosphodiesterase